MAPIRIVLAEDHALVREGTRHILEKESDFLVVGEAEDGDSAQSLIESLRPDVAILDMRMPGKNAIEVARALRLPPVPTHLMVLTAYDDVDYVVAALDAGVKGYLLKTSRASELVQAVRQVNRGETVLQPAIAGKVALMLIRRSQGTEEVGPEVLTNRELHVLSLAAQGLRNRDIATQIGVSVRTVEGHLSSILGKLGVSSRTAAVMHAASQGWLQKEPGDKGN